MGRMNIKRLPGLGRNAWHNVRISIAHQLTAMLLLMLLAAGTNIVFFKSLIHDFRDVAGTVSIAGKLRLLSQKIELDILQFTSDSEHTPTAVLNGIDEFETVLEALVNGGAVFGVDVRRVRAQHYTALEDVRSQWHAYRKEIMLALVQSGAGVPGAESVRVTRALRTQLSQRATRLLHASESMVDVIVKDMQHRQRVATQRMYIAFAVIVLSFLLTLWFVRRRVARPMTLLYDGARRLSRGDYHMQVHYPESDEMGRLISAFNNSAQHIGELVYDLECRNESLTHAETMFRSVVENSGIGVYVVSGTQFLFVNREMADMFGYKREEMLRNLRLNDVLVDDVPVKGAKGGLGYRQGNTAETQPLRHGRRHDGTIIELEIFESVMQYEGDDVLLCVALDVTKGRKDEASARLARLVYEVSSEAVVITCADANIIHVNPAFTQITGYQADEVLGKKMSVLSSGHHDKHFYSAMWASIEQTGSWAGELWNRRKNGDVFAERLSINTSYDEDGQVQYRVGLFSDITKRKKTDALIWKQANYDCLTNLPNRKRLQDELGLAIAQGQARGLGVALAFLDIDHFKDVNDGLGHQTGDELLKQAALRIQECLRSGDTVGRMGGDEFMLIICDLESASISDKICQRIMTALSTPFIIGSDVVKVTVSLGVTLFPQDGVSISKMFKNADMAMYEAKSKGRNQYCWFEAAMQEKVATRQRLTRELTKAIELEQFALVYQPIIDLSTGQICKAEALIRWNHPDQGVIGPGEFISFAEDCGVIQDIGDWVFKTAAHHVAQWRADHDDDFQVSLNVSPVQFLSEESGLSRWFDMLHEWKLSGSSLVVEITEGLLMDACGTVSSRLQAFQDGGIQVALDDFGTGYSSLAYLKKFDIDYIKIDRTFVSSLGPDTDERALCDAIIVMAHRLGLKVVGEGIETEEQYRFLKEAGCDYGQGFLFGRPMSSEQFAQLLYEQRNQHATGIIEL